jgi:hypothetical protein
MNERIIEKRARATEAATSLADALIQEGGRVDLDSLLALGAELRRACVAHVRIGIESRPELDLMLDVHLITKLRRARGPLRRKKAEFKVRHVAGGLVLEARWSTGRLTLPGNWLADIWDKREAVFAPVRGELEAP